MQCAACAAWGVSTLRIDTKTVCARGFWFYPANMTIWDRVNKSRVTSPCVVQTTQSSQISRCDWLSHRRSFDVHQPSQRHHTNSQFRHCLCPSKTLVGSLLLEFITTGRLCQQCCRCDSCSFPPRGSPTAFHCFSPPFQFCTQEQLVPEKNVSTVTPPLRPAVLPPTLDSPIPLPQHHPA